MSKDEKKRLDIKVILDKAQRALSFLQARLKFIFIIAILIIYSFLVYRVGVLSKAEPTPEEVNLITGEIKRSRIDKNAVETIEELESENIQVQTLFQEARDNPFTE